MHFSCFLLFFVAFVLYFDLYFTETCCWWASIDNILCEARYSILQFQMATSRPVAPSSLQTWFNFSPNMCNDFVIYIRLCSIYLTLRVMPYSYSSVALDSRIVQ